MMLSDAVERAREAARAIATLPHDDDRIPGLARDLAEAWILVDDAMKSGDMPLPWSISGHWRKIGR